MTTGAIDAMISILDFYANFYNHASIMIQAGTKVWTCELQRNKEDTIALKEISL